MSIKYTIEHEKGECIVINNAVTLRSRDSVTGDETEIIIQPYKLFEYVLDGNSRAMNDLETPSFKTHLVV